MPPERSPTSPRPPHLGERIGTLPSRIAALLRSLRRGPAPPSAPTKEAEAHQWEVFLIRLSGHTAVQNSIALLLAGSSVIGVVGVMPAYPRPPLASPPCPTATDAADGSGSSFIVESTPGSTERQARRTCQASARRSPATKSARQLPSGNGSGWSCSTRTPASRKLGAVSW